MKYTYKIENLKCANCAAKMESDIARLNGVNSVTISFMTQKMALDADEAKLDEILAQSLKICRKLERNVDIISVK